MVVESVVLDSERSESDAKPGLEVDEPGLDAKPAGRYVGGPGLDARDLDGSSECPLPSKCHGFAYVQHNHVKTKVHHMFGTNGLKYRNLIIHQTKIQTELTMDKVVAFHMFSILIRRKDLCCALLSTAARLNDARMRSLVWRWMNLVWTQSLLVVMWVGLVWMVRVARVARVKVMSVGLGSLQVD